MMGVQQLPQSSLFYIGLNIDKRVRANHPLRRTKQIIDFDFSYEEVKNRYGTNGNVSVPPPVILKLMLLLIFYNVRSERELMDTLPERIDWLWFLDYDLDSEIPDHSVLSKARLEEKSESDEPSKAHNKKKSRYISSTDPDAAIVNRGKPKLTYQVHRSVDERSEIITATEATAGDVTKLT